MRRTGRFIPKSLLAARGACPWVDWRAPRGRRMSRNPPRMPWMIALIPTERCLIDVRE